MRSLAKLENIPKRGKDRRDGVLTKIRNTILSHNYVSVIFLLVHTPYTTTFATVRAEKLKEQRERACSSPVPFLIQGETMIVGTRTPSLSNLKKNGAGPVIPSGLGTLV